LYILVFIIFYVFCLSALNFGTLSFLFDPNKWLYSGGMISLAERII
jgi:hypothetical protein